MNYYSGFLLGLMLICSSLFYGLALTSNDKKYQQSASVVDGTWRLISTKVFAADGRLISAQDEQQLQSIKVVANHHFSLISKSSDGTLIAAEAGRFAIHQDKYAESVELSAHSDQQQTHEYQWHMQQGLWYQRQDLGSQIIEQVWQLVHAHAAEH